jgi:hypothetical protein
MDFSESEKPSGKKARENKQMTCSQCSAHPLSFLDILDSRDGKTYRVYRCRCGEITWSERRPAQLAGFFHFAKVICWSIAPMFGGPRSGLLEGSADVNFNRHLSQRCPSPKARIVSPSPTRATSVGIGR